MLPGCPFHETRRLSGEPDDRDEWVGSQWSAMTTETFEAVTPLIARFMGPTWGPSGAERTQVGPMVAPWTLLSGDQGLYSQSRYLGLELTDCPEIWQPSKHLSYFIAMCHSNTQSRGIETWRDLMTIRLTVYPNLVLLFVVIYIC